MTWKRPLLLALCSMMLVLSAAGDELNGLSSRAIDVSRSVIAPNQFSAAFVDFDSLGSESSITVQSRWTDPTVAGAINCEMILTLPPAMRRVSHPALSTSGEWLFVSATSDWVGATGWRLFATRRDPLTSIDLTCGAGWTTWIDLGTPPGGSLHSAPDAVEAYGVYLYVFATDVNGQIVYRMLDEDTLGRNPNRLWSDWRQIDATSSNSGAFVAESKPAASIDQSRSGDQVHLFWIGTSRTELLHVRATVSIWGDLVEYPPDSRPLSDGAFPRSAWTACSAGPEVSRDEPLHVVCGIETYSGGHGTYLVARWDKPDYPWGDPATPVAWTQVSAAGGSTALPPLSCVEPGAWLIQNRSASGVARNHRERRELAVPVVSPAGR